MRLLLALAALLLAAPAWAGLPVAYDADYKTVKKNVFIGDPLGQVGGRTGGLRPIRYNVSTPTGSLSRYPYGDATPMAPAPAPGAIIAAGPTGWTASLAIG